MVALLWLLHIGASCGNFDSLQPVVNEFMALKQVEGMPSKNQNYKINRKMKQIERVPSKPMQ